MNRFARAESIDELLVKALARESKLDEFKPYLCRRQNEGARDAAVLHAELRQQGWNGSARTARRYIAPFRATEAAPEPPPAVPKTRQITKLLLTRPDHLDADEQEQLAGIRAQCPHLDALARHVTAFAEMMTDRTGSTALDDWLAAVGADDQPELHSFATGIRQDKEAVLNGLSLPYSSGKVEGHRQQDQDGQATDVRPRRLRPAPDAGHPAPRVTGTTKFAEEPFLMATDTLRRTGHPLGLVTRQVSSVTHDRQAANPPQTTCSTDCVLMVPPRAWVTAAIPGRGPTALSLWHRGPAQAGSGAGGLDVYGFPRAGAQEGRERCQLILIQHAMFTGHKVP